MPRNIEKFSTPDSMRDRQLEEGILDYEEQVKDKKGIELEKLKLEEPNDQLLNSQQTKELKKRADEEESVKQEMISVSISGNGKSATEIQTEFNIPEKDFFYILEQVVVELLSHRNFDQMYQLEKKYKMPKEIFIEACCKGIIRCLEDGNENYAYQIKEKYKISDEVLKSPAIVGAGKKAIMECIYKRNFSEANNIKTKFNIKISNQEILDAFRHIDSFALQLDELVPGFRAQVLKSEELLFCLFDFQNNPNELIDLFKENPFLEKAIEDNPKYASKLIIKYPEFDSLSKEHIRLLFKTKEDILTENPDIDQSSVEFRKLVQEKLKDYKNNAEILKVAQEKGVNTQEWLDYSQVEHFNLGENEDVPFSEVIATPIHRINETIESYAKTVKAKLGVKEYRLKLAAEKVSLDNSGETQEKIVNMQLELEKAKAANNEKKAAGIQKGIDSLKKQLEKPKKVSLWDKLVGDIDAFKILKNGVSDSNEKLKSAEESLNKELKKEPPDANAVKQFKKETSELKEGLKTKFKVLASRVEDFKNKLTHVISPILGDEIAEGIIENIQTSLAEQFDHYGADTNTLNNLFQDNIEKQENKLENQPMSIQIWARNPDVDLYQGNYTDCCIRIDSDHMGAESTIADYATDLGIQIVNIWDESENKPIVAAWCWLGINKQGEVALVVDNIEANTLYSNSYPEQLTQQLFEYLENYAKKIGVKKVVMGTANNDLPTSGKLDELPKDKKYKKLGGYNRDDGYFLEAEKDDVKVVWEESGE